MAEKWLMAFNPITFESFIRHATKHREPYDHYDMGYVDAVDQIEDWLNANNIDAVEVVRCKDCKHCRIINGEYVYAVCEKTDYPFVSFQTDTRTHFCSLGERKDNGQID